MYIYPVLYDIYNVFYAIQTTIRPLQLNLINILTFKNVYTIYIQYISSTYNDTFHSFYSKDSKQRFVTAILQQLKSIDSMHPYDQENI